MSFSPLETLNQSCTRYSIETLLELQPEKESLPELEFDNSFWENEGLLHKPNKGKYNKNNPTQNLNSEQKKGYKKQPNSAKDYDFERILDRSLNIKNKNNFRSNSRQKPRINPESKMIDELTSELKMKTFATEGDFSFSESKSPVINSSQALVNPESKQKSKFSKFFNKNTTEEKVIDVDQDLDTPKSKISIVEILNKSSNSKPSVFQTTPVVENDLNEQLQDNTTVESDEDSYDEDEEDSGQIVPTSVLLNKYKSKQAEKNIKSDSKSNKVDINALLNSKSNNKLKENYTNDIKELGKKDGISMLEKNPTPLTSQGSKLETKITVDYLFGLKKG